MLIDRYLIREIAKPFTGVCALLVAIFLVYSASERLEEVVEALQGVRTFLILIGLETLIALEVLLPLGLYLSVVFGVASLAERREIRALQASGVSLVRLLRPVALITLPVAAIVALLSFHVRPWAYAQAYRLEAKARTHLGTSKIEPGHFYRLPGEVGVLLATGANSHKGELEGVFLYNRQGSQRRIITAQKAHLADLKTGALEHLTFQNGHLYRLGNQQADFISRFGRMILSPRPPPPLSLEDKRKATATFDLIHSSNPVFQAELQWRLSTPLSVLLTGFIGLVLGARGAHRSRALKLLAAAILYGVYYNLAGMARNLMEQGLVGTAPGIWWVPLLFAMGLLITLFQPARLWR